MRGCVRSFASGASICRSASLRMHQAPRRSAVWGTARIWCSSMFSKFTVLRYSKPRWRLNGRTSLRFSVSTSMANDLERDGPQGKLHQGSLPQCRETPRSRAEPHCGPRGRPRRYRDRPMRTIPAGARYRPRGRPGSALARWRRAWSYPASRISPMIGRYDELGSRTRPILSDLHTHVLRLD